MRQLRRASISTLLNISEGFERKTNKDFAKLINISKGSAGECRLILYVTLDQNYINKLEFGTDLKIVCSLSNQLGTLEKYLLQTSK